ncbi:Uncharacterised protein [uncultured archaeon]|nr:Uncharacterised protein [uncultured archaeon]
MSRVETIVLFDMDDTLFDHNGQLLKDLKKLADPSEPELSEKDLYKAPPHIRERTFRIRERKEWWADLPKFQLGWDVWNLVGELSYQREILTKANLKNPAMWMGKVECIVKNIGEKTPVTITSTSKSRHYGRVLVDDFPEYCSSWLNHRPRGLVIMPAHEYNRYFSHPQLIRYDGTNLEEVRRALIKVKVQ